MFIKYNPNPDSKDVGDCVIRALSIATEHTWEYVYVGLSMLGYEMRDMPSANRVWGEYLRRNKFKKYIVPDKCPSCYTVLDFCYDHPRGTFVLATGSHVVAVVNGDYYDSWDSGNEVPVYYYSLEEY